MIGSDDEDETGEEAEDDSGFLSKATETVSEAADEVSDDLTDTTLGESDDETNIESEEPDFVASGKDGRVELYDDELVIRRDSVRAKLTKSHFDGQEIYYHNIGRVETTETMGSVFGGEIEFVRMTERGAPMDTDTHSKHSGWNRVSYGRSQRDEFQTLKEKVEKRANAARTSSDESDDETDSTDDTEDPAIQALREKFATGEISKEEFEERMEVLQNN